MFADSAPTGVAAAALPEGCRWSDAIARLALDGYNKEYLSHYTVDQCKQACEETTDFDCKSFDLKNGGGSSGGCYLSSEDRYTSALTDYSNYHYYEILCDNGER